METIVNIGQWLAANWDTIGVSLFLLMAAARVIILATPTKSDDAVFNKILGYVGLVVKPKNPPVDVKPIEEENPS